MLSIFPVFPSVFLYLRRRTRPPDGQNTRTHEVSATVIGKVVRGHKNVHHMHGYQTAYLLPIFVEVESRHAIDLAAFTHILRGKKKKNQH